MIEAVDMFPNLDENIIIAKSLSKKLNCIDDKHKKDYVLTDTTIGNRNNDVVNNAKFSEENNSTIYI